MLKKYILITALLIFLVGCKSQEQPPGPADLPKTPGEIPEESSNPPIESLPEISSLPVKEIMPPITGLPVIDVVPE